MKTEAYAELEQLYTRDACLRPEAVVQFATDPTTALHAAFEWDDSVAAVQHRLWQARQLIRAVVIVLPNMTEARRVYVHVEQDGDRRYLRIADVVRDPDLYAAALAELQRKVAAVERGIAELTAAAQTADQQRTAKRAQRATRLLAATLA